MRDASSRQVALRAWIDEWFSSSPSTSSSLLLLLLLFYIVFVVVLLTNALKEDELDTKQKAWLAIALTIFNIRTKSCYRFSLRTKLFIILCGLLNMCPSICLSIYCFVVKRDVFYTFDCKCKVLLILMHSFRCMLENILFVKNFSWNIDDTTVKPFIRLSTWNRKRRITFIRCMKWLYI